MPGWMALLRRREAWWPLLLAGFSLLTGALFQDPVRYGWLAGAATVLLLVRLAIDFEPPRPRDPATRLPAAPPAAYMRALVGLAVAALLSILLPPVLQAVAWALVGLALIAWGRPAGQHPLRLAGALVLLLALARATLVDTLLVRASQDLVRQLSFALVGLSGLGAIWTYRAGDGEGWARRWLTIGVHGAILWAITYEIADAIELTRGAASAGNEALWIAAAWGLYGLLLTLTAPLVPRNLPWQGVAQSAFTFALAFLLMGGLMAQARWADAPVRFAAYAAVLGGIWLAGWVQDRRSSLTEPDRLLALAAATLGFGICSFEVLRWLEPRFTYPEGTVTLAMLRRDQSLLNSLALAVWTGYGLLVLGAAAALRSRVVRFMGASLLLSTGLYLLLFLLLR